MLIPFNQNMDNKGLKLILSKPGWKIYQNDKKL